MTDGLVFYVDAGNNKSYNGVSGGTTWTDLAGNNNGTLTNMETDPANSGYAYDSGNGGSIVFDGVDDRVDLYSLDSTNSFTINFFFKTTSCSSSSNTGRNTKKRERLMSRFSLAIGSITQASWFSCSICQWLFV